MSEVLRLANALAEQMLGSQVMGRALPPHQLTALVRAARFLSDNNVSWPPLVQEVVRVATEKIEAARKA
ncbi:hypothetical protein [Methylobacterium sp. UNC300MFChir4.1]|uniref:hypothetical protein n=1 Tax=Methylobacterium sp. UNC300MFChir4.1 TaxID=1502747 RepID=UPI001113BDFC|nr:hypothetical protein [Methylobacterium sp. UNC300MFChir4.1]